MTQRLAQASLDLLWDFADPENSVDNFRTGVALSDDGSVIAAELTTQVARALGLQGKFDEADAELDTIEATPAAADPVVQARVALERGRLRNSSGHSADGIPLFEEALALASAEDDDFLAVDAAHMLAIADRDRAEHWTTRALETLAEVSDARTLRWLVSIHNNLGWYFSDTGRLDEALAEFELAADAARDYGTEEQRALAQEAIDETLEAIKKS